MLESRHLFVRQVGDDLKHLTTIAIRSIDFAHNPWLLNQLPAEHITENGSANKVLALHYVSVE